MILDTNALSAWADGRPGVRLHLLSVPRVVLPVVALGEYLFGILGSRHRQRYEEWLDQNLPSIELAMVDIVRANTGVSGWN
jgi:predicted nucleic acid-binding protein